MIKGLCLISSKIDIHIGNKTSKYYISYQYDIA